MPIFIVVHGSVSGKQIGEPIELTQEQADHINESGKMLRHEDEEEEPKQRADTGTRIGLDGKKKLVKLSGKVIDTTADADAELEEPAPDEEPEEAPKPAAKPAAAKKAPKPAAKKKGG